jgi:hypothetical protein
MSLRTVCCIGAIMCLFAFGEVAVRAQSGPGGFRAFLDHLPGPPTAPPDAELVKLDPNKIDSGDDISAAERQLADHLDGITGKNMTHSANQSGTTMNVQSGISSVHTRDHSIDERVFSEPFSLPSLTEDSCVHLGHRLHDLEFQFNKRLEAIDTVYNTRVLAAHARANAIDRDEPCNGSVKCIKRHRSERDGAIAAAERVRIEKRSEILKAQIAELAPMLTAVDVALPVRAWRIENEHFRRNLEELGDQALRLSITMAEQIKLNRLYIANCCKLLREANDR